jgi:hypothetical protein
VGLLVTLLVYKIAVSLSRPKYLKIKIFISYFTRQRYTLYTHTDDRKKTHENLPGKGPGEKRLQTEGEAVEEGRNGEREEVFVEGRAEWPAPRSAQAHPGTWAGRAHPRYRLL